MIAKWLCVVAASAVLIAWTAGCGRDPVTVRVPKPLLEEIEAGLPIGAVFLTSAKAPLSALADVGPHGIVALEINPAKDKGLPLFSFAWKFSDICVKHGIFHPDAQNGVGATMVPTPDVFVSEAMAPPKLVLAWGEDRGRIKGARQVKFVAQ